MNRDLKMFEITFTMDNVNIHFLIIVKINTSWSIVNKFLLVFR